MLSHIRQTPLLSHVTIVFPSRHRDRGEDHTVTAFGADGMPSYSTTWIALTDATAVNSCLYVVPRQYDEGCKDLSGSGLAVHPDGHTRMQSRC